MSGVMWEFMAPYISYAEDLAQMQKLAMIAAVAWNAAIMAEIGRADDVNNLVKAMQADAREDTMAVIGELIERKKRHFAENKRLIIKVNVTETGDGFHLAVAATMSGERP